MTAELIFVGTELLLGDILNTNAQYLSRRLSALGISVLHQCVIGDNPERLEEALKTALSRSDLVLDAEDLGQTVVEAFPDSEMAKEYEALAETMLEICKA